jgi:hypothetical protein
VAYVVNFNNAGIPRRELVSVLKKPLCELFVTYLPSGLVVEEVATPDVFKALQKN